MTLEYKVFHGVGAVVAEVKSNTLLSVLAITADKPVDFTDLSRRFDVNLELTLGRASWSNAQFGDRGTIGSGTLDDQTRGNFVGSVYIEHNFYKTLYNNNQIVDRNNDASQWPPTGYNLAAFTSIAYSESDGNGSLVGKHYDGYLAKVISESPLTVELLSYEGKTVPVNFNDLNFLSTLPPWVCENAESMTGSAAVASPGVLFIDRTYAKDTLHLTDPKIPIGLDAPGSYPSEPAPPQPDPPGNPPAKRPPHRGPVPNLMRINISLVDPDPILQTVLDKIDGEARVAGAFPTSDDRAGVFGVVSSRNKPGHPVAIDLIAHAHEGVLLFGSWQIGSTDQTSTMLQREWKNRSPSEIRLLGCNTASTTAGQAALRHLKSVFSQGKNDVRVYGATTLLFARDFGPRGFEVVDVLAEVDALPKAIDPPFPDHIVDSWFARLLPARDNRVIIISDLRNSLLVETFEDAVAASVNPRAENRQRVEQIRRGPGIDDLFNTLREGIFMAPGLLEIPDSEQLYPAGSVNGKAVFHRVTSFLGGAFVRLYTTDFPGGVLVRRQASKS